MTAQQLTDHQLDIMRRTYPCFREFDAVVRQVKREEQRYRDTIGYIPNKEGKNV